MKPIKKESSPPKKESSPIKKESSPPKKESLLALILGLPRTLLYPLLSPLLFLLLLWGCGLPDPFAQNTASKPSLSASSTSKSLTLAIDGDYSKETLPFFSGFNIYVGDNNDSNEILKRLLFISDKDLKPSIKFDLSKDAFPTNLAFSDFEFRFTSKATETDLQDDLISDTNDLVVNRSNWRVKSGRSFYFLVYPINNGNEQSISEVLEVRIPYIYEETIEVSEAEPFSKSFPLLDLKQGETDVPDKLVVSISEEGGNKVIAFGSSNTEQGVVVRSVNVGALEDWENKAAPSGGYEEITHPAKEGFVYFVNYTKDSRVPYTARLAIESIDLTNVTFVLRTYVNL